MMQNTPARLQTYLEDDTNRPAVLQASQVSTQMLLLTHTNYCDTISPEEI